MDAETREFRKRAGRENTGRVGTRLRYSRELREEAVAYLRRFTIRPGSGGSRGGLLGLDRDINFPCPSNIYYSPWLTGLDELHDSDLYLRHLSDYPLHSGIEVALRSALECLRKDLSDPAVAMLGSAVEGAWHELGQRLLDAARGQNLGKAAGALQGERTPGFKVLIDSVCKIYQAECFGGLRKTSGVSLQNLRDIAAWSDVVREARNVLHWSVDAVPHNSYPKVAALLMGALTNLNQLP